MHRHFMGFFLVRRIIGFSYNYYILGNALQFPDTAYQHFKIQIRPYFEHDTTDTIIVNTVITTTSTMIIMDPKQMKIASSSHLSYKHNLNVQIRSALHCDSFPLVRNCTGVRFARFSSVQV